MADIKFTPPSSSNNAVMVNDNNQLRNPTAEQFLQSNPEFAKASDLTNYGATIDSLEKKTQNMSSSVGKTTFSGSISSGSISSNNINVSGDLNVEGTLKASNIGNLIGKSLSVENLTVTDTLTAKNFEIDIPDTILNVEGIKSKGIIEANDFQETYPNKFVKGWFLARVEDSENEGNKNIYISNKQYSYAEITSAELPSDFETADFSNISVNDVFYFYNSRHFPYAFRVISIYENYLEVKEIEDNSLTIISSNLSNFRYGLFIIGTWDNLNNSVVFSPAKIDAGYANFYNNILAIGDDNSLGYNSCSTGTSCSSIGMYSSCIGNGNVAISYSSTAFGQNNFVLGEKCSAIGANNNIECGNGNVAFGYNNRIYSSNVGTTISESSVALGQGIKIDTTVNPKISLGKYNLDDDNIIFSVGNGTSDNNRSNAFEVYRDGDFNSPTIEYLKTSKVNSGSLHFNVGTLTIPSKANNSEAYSHCFTMAYSYEDFLNTSSGCSYVGTCLYSSSDNGWFIHRADYQGKAQITLLSFNKTATGTSTYTTLATGENIKKFFDGTPKKFVIVRDSVNTRLYLDNVLIKTLQVSANGADNFLFKVGYKAGSPNDLTPYFKGKVSDVAVFNFDITAEDAPYTINDYQNGKPISPYLLDGNAYFLDSTKANGAQIFGYPQYNSAETIFNTVEFIEGSGFESTVTEAGFNQSSSDPWTMVLINLPIEVKIGDVIDFELGQHQTIINGEEPSNVPGFSEALNFYKKGNRTDWLQGLSKPKSNTNYRLVFSGAENTNRIGIQYSFNKSATSVKDIFPFKLKVNGAEVALDNFTFGGEVLDYSGNGRHGSITGSVKGDNDTKIETLFEKFSTRISNQTNG